MSRKEELIVGLDIGTTKICAVVGERSPSHLNAAQDVHLESARPILGRGALEGTEERVERGHLHHAVETAESLGGGLHQGFATRGVARVRRAPRRTSTREN